MRVLEQLEPKNVLSFFEDLCAIPHGSGNTKAISVYCVKFAESRGLEVHQDGLNNVVIVKPATPGYEAAPTVIVQGHLDMVAEKTPDSPINFLTDGLELLLNPLKKIKVPVHELSMMMSIALRFIPTLIEETDKIMSAQKARGADFESGNIFQRAKALVPILVPLFISAFRRADELATAMECRCYHGGEGRTALHVLHYKTADWLTLAGFVALAAGVIVLGKFGL